MTLHRLLAIAGLASLFICAHADSRAATPSPSSASSVSGLDAPEDIVSVGNGAGVIASSLDAGGLYFIDTKTRAVAKIDIAAIPEVANPAYPCPAPLRASGAFITHGLSIKPSADGHDRLYAVRHGGREAIEIFQFGRQGDVKSLQWIGCVPLPKGFSGNAVVGRKDGGFYTTSMTDMGDATPAAKLEKLYSEGTSGAVLAWSPSSGFSEFHTGGLAGPNGIELSPDESALYVAAWSGHAIWKFDLSERHAAPHQLKVSFMPDNLRWADNGILFAAGVHSTPRATMSCAMQEGPNERCATYWTAVGIDSRTMNVVSTESVHETSGFGDVSTALKIGDELWLGSFAGNTIGIRPMARD